ncbi:MAG: DNA-processing protein DprA [Selenomonadaceae bacterium]|nr:DNA-processing protein DprA [Selenomonadaceae bacterium]
MERYYLAAMGGAEGFGNKSIKKLVEFCGSAKAAWSADISDLIHAGIHQKPLDAFVAFRGKHPNAPEKLVGYCERHEFKICSISDEDYPPLLKEIDAPPMFFYYRGKLEPHAQRIGIVGSRENTQYGQSVALELGEQLAAAGLTVVSGAARGIDTFAHRGALKTGRTVAVLGCGIELAFRSGKKNFFEQMTERGVVLSEFPPQLRPNVGTFPTRNRIIAGLSRGVIVVEAGKKSGALITSTYAGEYGRDVFAIPGEIYAERSEGCNELIRDGATLIKSAQDVLDEYGIEVGKKIKPAEPKKQIVLEGVAGKILDAIPFDKFITDDEILIKVDEVAPYELPSIMLELEMKGCVTEDAGRYKRS